MLVCSFTSLISCIHLQEKAKQALSENITRLPRDRLGFVGNLLLQGRPGAGLSQELSQWTVASAASRATDPHIEGDSLYLEGSSVFGSMIEEQPSVESVPPGATKQTQPTMKDKLSYALLKLKEKYNEIDLSVLKQYLPTNVPPDAHLDWLDVPPSDISVHPFVDMDLLGNTEEGWQARTRTLYADVKPIESLASLDASLHQRHASKHSSSRPTHSRHTSALSLDDKDDAGSGSDRGSGSDSEYSGSSSSSEDSLFHDLGDTSESDGYIPDEDLQTKLNRYDQAPQLVVAVHVLISRLTAFLMCFCVPSNVMAARVWCMV